MAFDQYAICRNGHVVGKAPFGNVFHVHVQVCRRCGDDKGGPFTYNWEVVSMRWVSTSRGLFHPSTWGGGYWQNADGDTRTTEGVVRKAAP